MLLPNPTPNTNYIFNEQILVGWYPGGDSNNLSKILSTGRDVFVNLTEQKEIDAFGDYRLTVRETSPECLFLNYPIRDSNIPVDLTSFNDFVSRLYELYQAKKKFYIHCRGGHGRTGIVCACLLMRMGYTADQALDEVMKAHRTRENLPDYPSPETQEQRDFVKNFAAVL